VAHALRGLVLIGRRNSSGARVELQRALELSPGQPEALAGLTSLDMQAKTPSKAIDRLETALSRQPDDTNLVLSAARTYSATGNASKAEQILRDAVTANPRFSAGYAMLAAMYRQQNRMEEARVEYEGIAKRDANAVGARTMVGVLFEMQGKRDEARKWYEQIVGGTQSSPVAANNLAFMYAEQAGNLDIALQLATSAKPQMPDDPQIDDTIGWIYYKKGLMSLAKEPLEASARKLPGDAGVLYHLGMTYAALGDKTQARSTLTKARALDPRIGGDELQKALVDVSR
jgi:tetratricopeptide (TPR) repeat protein